MRKLITLFLIAFSLSVSGQTYKTVTGALNDSTTILRAGTYSANLDERYQQIQDGLLDGGEATIGAGSVTIDTAVFRINKINYTSLPRTFTGIANSPSGTQYYLVVYGEIGGTLDTISGARDTLAVMPTIPANTVKVNTVLVGDGGVESSAPDLSGFALRDGSNAYGVWDITSERANMWGGRIADLTEAYSGDLVSILAVSPDGVVRLGGSSDIKDYLELDTISFGAIGSSPNANGASISSGVITLQPANTSFGGLVTTGTQSFSGDKTYSGTVTTSSTGGFYLTNGSTWNINTASDALSFSETNIATRFKVYKTTGNFHVGYDSDQGFKLAVNGTGFFASKLSLSAGTTSVASFRMPYGVAPTTPVAGDMWALTTGVRMQRFDGTNTKDFIFDKTNFQFVGTGVRAVTSNPIGDLAATTPIIETYTTDTDVITAILAGTYSPTATLTPANSKIFYKGQLYYASGSLYFATADNVALKTDATRTMITTASGTGAATTISIPHGLGYTPFVIAQAGNVASAGITYTDADVTNINIYYSVAPASGTDNLRYKIILK